MAQASAENLGTCYPVLKEKNSKRRTRKDESTDTGNRGGTARSSDEVSVMEMERRGCVI